MPSSSDYKNATFNVSYFNALAGRGWIEQGQPGGFGGSIHGYGGLYEGAPRIFGSRFRTYSRIHVRWDCIGFGIWLSVEAAARVKWSPAGLP